MAQIIDTTGVILAGGKSLRFGGNKALALWRGRPMIESVLDAICPLFETVLIVAKDPSEYASLEPRATIISDRSSDSHPVSGITAALDFARTSTIFVCGCDMPLLRSEIVEAICEKGSGYPAAAPVWRGVAQPLAAVYSKGCRSRIQLQTEVGKMSLQSLLAAVNARLFPAQDIGAPDDDESFADIDTSDEHIRLSREVNR